MTDDRPEPRYGQYAPLPPVPLATPVPVVPPEAAGPDARSRNPAAARPRRIWDVALTAALLVVGTYDVAGSFAVFSNLGAQLDTLYQQQGFGHFTSLALASQWGTALIVVRVALLVGAIVTSLALVRIGRLAFWVPLAAGALALIAVVVCILVLVTTDPALAQYVASHRVSG